MDLVVRETVENVDSRHNGHERFRAAKQRTEEKRAVLRLTFLKMKVARQRLV